MRARAPPTQNGIGGGAHPRLPSFSFLVQTDAASFSVAACSSNGQGVDGGTPDCTKTYWTDTYSSLPVPTVGKVLKLLAHAGLLVSQRGIKGGYALARDASAITMVDIIDAVEGPIALTDCIGPDGALCEIEAACPTRTNWHRINDVLIQMLRSVTLAEMTMSPLDFNALFRRTADAAAPAARV